MPLLLIDLDDSLIDRRAGFRNWAREFCSQRDLGEQAGWLEEADGRGYVPRLEFLAGVRERFGLADSADELFAAWSDEYPTYMPPPSDEALSLLRHLRGNGWKIGVVTNGSLGQLRKLGPAGLEDVIDACCVSGIEGVRKPEPRIFELAAERCGEPLEGAWMAGDNPDADIGGAHALGLRTIWFRLGREWTEPAYAPTFTADSLEEALDYLARLP